MDTGNVQCHVTAIEQVLGARARVKVCTLYHNV